jgi:hypothetical protein
MRSRDMTKIYTTKTGHEWYIDYSDHCYTKFTVAASYSISQVAAILLVLLFLLAAH